MKLLVLLAAVLLAVGIQAKALEERGQPSPQELTASYVRVDLPLTPQGWSKALGALASRERRAVGLELLPGEAQVFPADKPGTILALDGLSLLQAARLLAQHDTRYAVQQDTGGVLSVRPLASINSRTDFLNRTLAHFELDAQPVVVALDMLHQQLDPAYRVAPRHLERLQALDRQSPGRAARVRAALSRPISLKLENRTIREILNSLAVADGEMWWIVSYDKTLGNYHESRISFVGYDSWTIAAKARHEPRSSKPGGE